MCRLSLVACLHGHKQRINDVSCSSGDVNLLLSSSSDASVRVWDLRQNKSVAVLSHQPNEECYSASLGGNTIAVGAMAALELWYVWCAWLSPKWW